MTSLTRLVAAIAATATLQLGVTRVVSAQNSNDSWCFDSRFDNLNATASYSVPGFAPPGDDSSKGTWNFSTGVVTYDGNITQRLWINTSPSIQVDSDDLPYQGCILALSGLAGKPGEDNNGDCTSSLGQECVAALLNNSNEVAKSFSAKAEEDAQKYNRTNRSIRSLSLAQCTDFVATLPNVCQKPSSDLNYTAVPFIGHHPALYANETLKKAAGIVEPDRCPDLGGDGTAATSPILEFISLPAPFSDFQLNYNTYDEWKSQVLPVLVPVWSKDSKNPWADTRLVCMRPEEVAPPDNIGPATQDTSGGVRVSGFSSRGTFVLVGLIGMTTALLFF